jgi:hypothetical protein
MMPVVTKAAGKPDGHRHVYVQAEVEEGDDEMLREAAHGQPRTIARAERNEPG